MITSYILILIILFPGDHPGSMIATEFNSLEACQVAAAGYNNHGFDRDKQYNPHYMAEISARCWKK